MSDIVKYKKWSCHVELGFYANNRLAISLTNAVNDSDSFIGEPISTASLNLPKTLIQDDEIFIKNSEENEGMLEALQKAGYVGQIVKHVSSGFIQVPLVKKTEKLQLLENEFRSQYISISSSNKNKY